MTDTFEPGGVGAREPRFSLVVPVYNVEAFLPAFLESLDGQTDALTECELIFVDDGSTDGSAALVEGWISRAGDGARLVSQPNRGLSAARNAGLRLASGQWVTFPDPDDVLDPDYLRRVRELLASTTVDPDLVCTRLMVLDHDTGRVSDSHPLRAKFRDGTRIVDLAAAPENIHLSAASAFYRRARVQELGLEFDGSIRPNFEDASFTALYLVASSAPRVAIVADALYLYRKRSDTSSIVQGSWLQEDKYTTVLERGHLALLRRVADRHASVPRWVQNLVLYDLLFYLRTDQRTLGGTAMAPRAWTDRFHELAEQVLAYIDVETIDAFAVMPTDPQLRAALIVGYKRQRILPGSVRLERLDTDQGLVQARYFCGDPDVTESVRVAGRPTPPAYAKTRDLVYLNRVLAHERILWIPLTGDLDVTIDGQRVPLDLGAAETVLVASPQLIRSRLVPDPRTATASLGRSMRAAVRARFPRAVRAIRRVQRSMTGRGGAWASAPAPRRGPFAALDRTHDAQLIRAARSARARRRYAGAWTFMDRDTEAHDNAEHLYRYVRRHHPEVNAWFVLRREAADWDRLATEGFRLIPFGSPEHAQLLLNTTHLVSSQVDDYVTHPLERSRFGERSWRFTFLQHGVIHTDLSRWLNPKPIDRFITSSSAEHAAITGDHTPYVFTEKEVRLTGLPRHDRLLELRREAGSASHVLIMPTWRGWLLVREASGNARALKAPLAETEFWRAWIELIGSEALRSSAERAGLKIVLVPHPNLQPHVTADDLPSWVDLCPYDRSDVQALLAEAAVMLTDYSSQAFEAAYVECPVVYYQFDRDAFFAGTHVGRRGTWDYETDGFGPVVTTGDAAVEAVRATLAAGGPDEVHRARMHAAFPFRDGRCCERTVESILSLIRPAT